MIRLISIIRNGSLIVLILLTIAGLGQAQGVPSQYTALYQYLQTNLNSYEANLDRLTPAEKRSVIFATELLAANGNRGADLFQSGVMDTVKRSLDRFQEIGIEGVTVAVGYPLFDPSFPRHDDYVAFFQSVAEEIHQRGMKLDIECAVAFANTPAATFTWDWSGYTVESLATAKRAMLNIILTQIQPDYLNLGSEPSTDAQLTGIHSLNDPQAYAHFVELQVQGLNKGSTLVGAGSSAWENTAIASLIADISELDTLTFHVYPVDPTSQQNSLALADIAQTHGKRLILDEAWLHKLLPSEGGGVAMISENLKRDSYSFFAPLDQQFLRCMAKLAQVDGVEYLSAFNSDLFFAYLDYSDALDAEAYAQVATQLNQAVSMAMKADTWSSTGEFMKALIAQYTFTVDFIFDPSNPTDAEPVTFTAVALGGAAPYAFSWNICGTEVTGNRVTHTLPAGGCTVTLQATDATGATASVTKTVSIAYPVTVSSVTGRANFTRLNVMGSGFEQGCFLTINGTAVPQTIFESGTQVSAIGGSGLRAMIPKGVTVEIQVLNPDGGRSAPIPFKR